MKVGTKIKVTDTEYPQIVPNGSIMTVTEDYGSGHVKATICGGDGFAFFMHSYTYEEYAPQPPASQDDTPKLWRDMAPEEKGALLLAHHEGKEIEIMSEKWVTSNKPIFHDVYAYRIKPEVKVEVVVLYGHRGKDKRRRKGSWGFQINSSKENTHRITFNTIDGKPDPASIKMTAL